MTLADRHPLSGEDFSSRVLRLRLLAFDFDGVFTDNMVYVDQDGTESVRCSRADGLGLRRLEAVGVEPVIISTETNEVVPRRAEKLKILCFHGCDDKLAVLKELIESRGWDLDDIGFVGNDVNDLACLVAVGLPLTVADAHPSVGGAGQFRTELPGGHGAVREICDAIADIFEVATA